MATPTKEKTPRQQISYPLSFHYIAGHAPAELSAKAGKGLRRVEAWRALMEHGMSGQQEADTLHLARLTVYRWERRLKT